MSEIGYNMEMTEESEQVKKLSDLPSPGQKLQKLREEMGLSHGRVAEALHMTAHYVRSLECNQFDKLPGKTFVKGYFKAYARLLNADVDEVLECYEQYVIALEESQENEADEIRAKKAYDQNLRWMICAAIIIVLVIGTSWWLSREGNASAAVVAPVQRAIAEVSASDSVPVTAEAMMANLGESRESTGLSPQWQEATTVSGVVQKDITSSAENEGQIEGQSEGQKLIAVIEPAIDIETTRATDLEVLSTGILTDDSQALELDPNLDKPVPIPGDYTVNRFADHREIQLESEGNDLLEIHFSGTSWIEVDNVENERLYNDMLNTGDGLFIKGKAPFNILVGDANMVEMTFNSKAVDVMARIRNDNSVRLVLAPETR